jgi:hypothetical protein
MHCFELLMLCCCGVAFVLVALASAFFDTTCHKVPFTTVGLARLEPIKASNLGTFNCSGSFTYYNPATGHVTATINLPWFNQSTLYEPSCSCWVTTSFTLSSVLPLLVIYKYSNMLPGHTKEGSCLEFNWLEDNSNMTQSITFRCNMHFNMHHDLPYMHKANNTLTQHQSFYQVVHSQNELVMVHKFNKAGYINWIENLMCFMIKPQVLF